MKRFLDGLSPVAVAFFQAALTLLYIAFFAFFVIDLVDTLGIEDAPLAPMFFLTLFIFSALLIGTLVLAYPLVLFLENERTRAVHIVIWSAAWFLAALVLWISWYLFPVL